MLESQPRKIEIIDSLQTEQRKNDQKKFGIDYDDDYDYMQHLRDPCAPPERYAVQVNKVEEEEDDVDEYEDEEEEEEVKTPICLCRRTCSCRTSDGHSFPSSLDCLRK